VELKFNNLLIYKNNTGNAIQLNLKENMDIKTLALIDLITLININDNEKRNYHLWKYLINMIKAFPEILFIKLLYFYFAVECLSKNPTDYSAFSFLVNVFNKNLMCFNQILKEDRCLNELSNKNEVV